MRPLRILVVLTSALLALAASPAGSASGAASGVVVNTSGAYTPQGKQLLDRLGAAWVRSFVSWADFEPAPGRLDEGAIAYLEGQLAALPRGAKVILDVVNSPQWASGSTIAATPPRDPAAYAAFIGRLAGRLRSRVAAYEIWNEEDDSLWWSSGPNPALYAAMLRDSYRAIKAVEPHATVVLGGLTGNDYEYLSELYAQGAKGAFDAVSVHTDTLCTIVSPYEFLRNRVQGHHLDFRINRWSFLGYRTVHEVMLAHGDRKPIWMTELGWSTFPHVCNAGRWAGQKAGGVSPQQQATFLLEAYHCLKHDRYVQVGIWYGLQDTGPFDSPRGEYGLLDADLAPRPAYSALAEYARHGDRLRGSCGNFKGPKIELLHPARGMRFGGALRIAVRASDPTGVARISLFGDRQPIYNFAPRIALRTLGGTVKWTGARALRRGRHLLTVTASDMKGNTTRTSVNIYRR
jgi:hypothetical protein